MWGNIYVLDRCNLFKKNEVDLFLKLRPAIYMSVKSLFFHKIPGWQQNPSFVGRIYFLSEQSIFFLDLRVVSSWNTKFIQFLWLNNQFVYGKSSFFSARPLSSLTSTPPPARHVAAAARCQSRRKCRCSDLRGPEPGRNSSKFSQWRNHQVTYHWIGLREHLNRKPWFLPSKKLA